MTLKVIEYKKAEHARGGWYILECNYCKKHFKILGSRFRKGQGLFCSRKCKNLDGSWKISLSSSLKNGFKNGRKHPKGMLGKLAWNSGKENKYWKGDKNPNWNNGSSFICYGIEFTKILKNEIRKRDNYICQECGVSQDNLDYQLIIHHIDYNKMNSSKNNLISLCRNCHSKTNFSRIDWENYFKLKLHGDICRTLTINKINEVRDKKHVR